MKKKINLNLCINIAIWLVITFALALLAEGLQRNSMKEALHFFDEKTKMFLLNYAMFLSLTSISFLFKKTRFVYSILSFILFAGHAVSGMLTGFRGTPLIWADLYSIKSGIAIADQYISKEVVVSVAIVIIIIATISIVLWKTEKVEGKYKIFNLTGIIIIAVTFALTGAFDGYMDSKGLISKYVWDMPNTYKDSGFMYSFLFTRDGFKVEKPKEYKKEKINDILDTMQSSLSVASTHDEVFLSESNITPNIILIQLESFFDPYRLQGLEFSVDPIPTFRELYDSSPSGYVQVPAYGGGTVRTEFEVLTGFTTDYLPVGEIPNHNVLKTQPVESLAHILRNKGYESSAIHNYHGDFYNRNVVYSNLGFDLFISTESMPESTIIPWRFFPEDKVNLPYIQRLIDDNDEPQFIVNLIMESHGSYSSDYDGVISEITGDITEKEERQLQHYLRNIKGVDEYIKALLEYINSIDEPTVLIMYGDHLPSLDILKRDGVLAAEEDMYKTEYLITDNIGIVQGNDKLDMEAYQLGSYALELIDMVDGIIPTFHEKVKNSESYQEEFEILQYDLLFGEKYVSDRKNIYQATNLQIGLDQMVINHYKIQGNKLIIQGENFNKYSTININKKDYETIFEDESTLIVETVPDSMAEVKVVQRGVYNTVLGESNTIKVE